MPIYEYYCEDCSHEFEVTQKITDKPKSVCPKCGGHVKKLISHTTFVLKGSGWYVTDYGGKKAESKDKSEKDSSKEKGSDTTKKPEEKKD